eukprot:TRINITY_DN2905_c0_g1_i1.p1 TRINITY_DN2905_c0_g1~~TRINITY_DN2905_c0_g1_i1.p1  ORF type:complete len:131 (-),score=3.64 TRINITY_DN2905_c0_g1_i1:37-429(-)
MASAASNATRQAIKSRLAAAKAPITLTEKAATRIKELLSRKPEVEGVRLGVRTRGCNGLSYTMDYFKKEDLGKFDEVVEQHGVKVSVDPKALMFVIGTKMDFYEDDIKREFMFSNPNSKGECGCGESFNT